MAVKIFFCYAHEDELYLNKLKAYLRPLQRQELIDVWYDRDISAGTDWEREISQRLNEAKIILLLVSPDFMNSDYCYSVEMKRALERHQRKEAIIIPVILRPIYWQGVLGKLQALPTDAKPLVDRYWHTLDEALYDVAEGIRKVVVQVGTKPVSPPEALPSQDSKRESTDVSLTVLTPQPATSLPSLKPEAVSLLNTLFVHTFSVYSVAFSPDGHTLASGSTDQTIRLWNVATGQEVRTLTGHADSVRSVAFSPDGHTFGHTLASGGDDGTITLWNVATGQEVRALIGHTSIVNSVAFSPDGHTLASGSWDQTIKLWGKK
jgi:TIR domain-containing protein/WD40 domain-containing protein